MRYVYEKLFSPDKEAEVINRQIPLQHVQRTEEKLHAEICLVPSKFICKASAVGEW